MSTKLYNVAMSRMTRFVLKKNNDSLFSYVYLKGMICCLYKYEKMKCVRNIIHFYVAILKATFSKRTKWTNNWCQDIVWSGFIFDFMTLTSIENSTFLKNTVVPYVSINVISRYNSTLIWIFWQPIMTIYHIPLYRIGWLYYKGFSRNLSRTGHKIKQSIYNTVTLPNKWYIYGKKIFHELFNWQWCMDKNR